MRLSLNAVAVPGRVGMEECSLDLITPLFFKWVGVGGAVCFRTVETSLFLDIAKAFVFVTTRSLLAIAIRPYTQV